MAHTKRQLAIDVMRQLGETPAEGEPSGLDVQYIARVYDTKLASWRDQKLVYWGNTGLEVAEIPEAVYQDLILLLENWVGNTYGRTTSTAERIAVERELLKPLRRHVARPPTGLPLRTDYF